MKQLSQAKCTMETVLPKRAKWIKDSAEQFKPDANQVITKDGHTITYDILVIAVGLQLNYDKVFVFIFHIFKANLFFKIEFLNEFHKRFLD